MTEQIPPSYCDLFVDLYFDRFDYAFDENANNELVYR